MFERPPTDERLRPRGNRNLSQYFVLVMGVVYTGLGLYLLLSPATFLSLPSTPRRILGVLLVFYGIIRFVRTYRQNLRQTNDE
ncbi:hypothetical protein [Hymenobacter sp. BT730]|uniref:hypothetical protein n=1 Tax=Hymenobacter sp. BT730 TaxID=3063332 RepID=UPI0026DFD48B|nr:hypothetical protein [Hymenobacter sp. BT730]